MLFTYRNIWKLFLIYIILDGCRNKSSMTEVGKTKPKKCKQKSVGSYSNVRMLFTIFWQALTSSLYFRLPLLSPPAKRNPSSATEKMASWVKMNTNNSSFENSPSLCEDINSLWIQSCENELTALPDLHLGAGL